MFSHFGSTAETLSKASTMVFRIGTDAHLYDDPEDVSIAPLLDSKFDSEKCEALKRLLALIAQGFDVSNFFPQVVKNVASQTLEVKKLVYLYLLHYAEKRPNEALLSINYFQKDLGDPNPLVRAWALRTMAGIRLHVIAPLVLVAVGKCARDAAVYVRKSAANALPKLYDLHIEENVSELEEIVGVLLNDNSPGVVGAAASAFTSVCPNNLTLIGRSYRKLCETLPDVEEWGQIVLIGILLRYVIARHGLVKESVMFSSLSVEDTRSGEDSSDTNLASEEDTTVHVAELANMITRCYIEGPDEYLSQSGFTNSSPTGLNITCFIRGKSNDDVVILLRCTSPLLWSHNSAVVLAAAGVHWIMAPKENLKTIVKPLLFVLRSSISAKYMVLCNIQVFAKAMPALFAPHYEDFFTSPSDSYQIKALKLEILSSIATDSSMPFIFQEFQDYFRDPDRRFAADTVAAVGLCAQRLPKMANTCLEGLLALTGQESLTVDFESGDGESDVLIQAIMSIKTIIKKDPPSHEKVIIYLVRRLDTIKVPAARAIIIWILGEYNTIGQTIPRMLTTVLKYLAWCFVSEAEETKLQILNATSKVLLSAKGEELLILKKLLNYILELAKFDLHYDIRDRARILKKLLSFHLDSQDLEEECKSLPRIVAEHIFVGPKKPPSPEPINYRFYLPGSLSQIVLHAAPGYEPLPKPHSLALDDLSRTNSDSDETDDHDSSSSYSSHDSVSGSDRSDENGSATDDENVRPLIQISDSRSDDGEGLLSKKALESWLDEQPGSSEQSSNRTSLARISIGDIGDRIKPKSHTLLDPTNGNGLRVMYSFSLAMSSISPLLISVEVSFENSSTEPMSKLSLVDEEPHSGPESRDQAVTADSSVTSHNDVPSLVSVEEIPFLEPGQTMTRTIQVRFYHHLLPLKLALWCNGKKYPVKLRPDIGYFVKPLPMEPQIFAQKESQLPGMFEYIRRCTFTDHIEELGNEKIGISQIDDKFLVICKSLALKMLNNANLALVSVDMPVTTKLDDASGLRLRFSSQILSNSIPCLITIVVEGKCTAPLDISVKVNCEETVFGLNLLNRIVNYLVDRSLSH